MTDLRNYWEVIKKPQWYFFVFLCLFVGTVACGAYRRQPYTAATTVLVESQAFAVTDIQKVRSLERYEKTTGKPKTVFCVAAR